MPPTVGRSKREVPFTSTGMSLTRGEQNSLEIDTRSGTVCGTSRKRKRPGRRDILCWSAGTRAMGTREGCSLDVLRTGKELSRRCRNNWRTDRAEESADAGLARAACPARRRGIPAGGREIPPRLALRVRRGSAPAGPCTRRPAPDRPAWPRTRPNQKPPPWRQLSPPGKKRTRPRGSPDPNRPRSDSRDFGSREILGRVSERTSGISDRGRGSGTCRTPPAPPVGSPFPRCGKPLASPERFRLAGTQGPPTARAGWQNLAPSPPSLWPGSRGG